MLCQTRNVARLVNHVPTDVLFQPEILQDKASEVDSFQAVDALRVEISLDVGKRDVDFFAAELHQK